MIFEINPDSPIEKCEQIVSQVIFSIASGDVEPGSLIPSIRDLAQQITVHPNTVAKAYQELEKRGILEAKRGRGMEVTPDSLKICRSERQDIVRKQIRLALREAVASALSPDEVRQLVDEELHRVNGKKG
jgi:GntR family transcriptional regulator